MRFSMRRKPSASQPLIGHGAAKTLKSVRRKRFERVIEIEIRRGNIEPWALPA
jgi:hypothetical protein